MSVITCVDQVAHVRGTIDFDSVLQFERSGKKAILQHTEIEFDFSGVTRANSAALALLLAWQRYAKQQGRRVRFTHLPQSVVLLAKMSRLNKVFEEQQWIN